MPLFLRVKSKFRKQLLYHTILESILSKATDLKSYNKEFGNSHKDSPKHIPGVQVVGKSGKVLLVGVYTEQAKNARQQRLDH